MPDSTPHRDRDAPYIRQPASRPEPDPRWCRECEGDLRHEPLCPLVEDARELAGALVMGATIGAMGKGKR